MLVEESTDKLGLYTGIGGPMSANTYYRLMVPFKTAGELGLAEHFVDGQQMDHYDKEIRLLACVNTDIHAYYMPCSDKLIENVKILRDLPAAPDLEGKMCYPPTIVFDADDDLENIDVLNERFGVLGTRLPNGRVLGEGDTVFVPDPSGGEDIPLWQDGNTYGHRRLSWVENHERLRKVQDFARMADGVTTTVEYLANKYRGYGCENVHVFPNSIREQDFINVELAPHPNEVRILWQGGISHFVDWYPLRNALKRVAEKYDHVTWVMWGSSFRYILSALPEEKTRVLPWIPFDGYFTQLSTIGHDISLAPLVDNEFNRCKSAIKWYEASAICNPAATLAGNAGPYGQEIEHGETGMLYSTPEEFEEHLCTLIESAQLRNQLAENARDWVFTHRDARKTVPKLIDWYRSMRESQAQVRR